MIDETDGVGTWSYHGLCPKCGKPYIYIGDVPSGGFTKGLEPYCTCNENKNNFYGELSNTFHFNNQGWICPKCGKVFSPNIIECIYCNSVSASSVWGLHTTNTVTWDENDDIQFTFTDDKEE